MTLRAPPPRRHRARRTGFALALLLPVTAAFAARPVPSSMDTDGVASRPYLAVVSAPALRFEERIPPPDLSVRPPAGAPPQPAATSGKTDTAGTSPAPAAESIASIPPIASPPSSENSPNPGSGQTAHGGAGVPASHVQDSASEAPQAPAKPPTSILPDDTRPKVRAEDFLPFFQFPAPPANANDVTLVPAPPVPGQQPPSSATYRQQ